MPGRPKKYKVDYFSHDCKHGKTLKILESRFGNNGYAVWFKLLEELGDTEGHVLDLNDEIYLEYISGPKMHISGAEMEEILDLLAKLGAIDPELWEKRLVWCQNFVDRLSDVYEKRKCEKPSKPSIREINSISAPENGINPPGMQVDPLPAPISGVGNTQSKAKESKGLKQTETAVSDPVSPDNGKSHYSTLVGKILPQLDKLAAEISRLPEKTPPFNPYEFIQKYIVNEQYHVEVVLRWLKVILAKWSDMKKSPYAYCRDGMRKDQQLKEHEGFKRMTIHPDILARFPNIFNSLPKDKARAEKDEEGKKRLQQQKKELGYG